MRPEKRVQKSLILMLGWFLVTIGLSGSALSGDAPQNVIFLIGDGMGFEQVRAAGMYLNGNEGTLSFEILPYKAEMTTYSANSSVTDSAAAATAIATGVKANNGVVSVAIPGDGSEFETLLEYFRDRGKSTGLVTTTNMTDATPACFGAHDSSRYNTLAIATDYLNQSRPNVLFGGGGNGMDVSNAQSAGYTVVTDAFEMLALDTSVVNMTSGQFGSDRMPFELDGLGDLPHLSEMTNIALDILANDPDGFFLMVEGGRIDHAGHSNDIQRSVHETIEFSYAVQEVIEWAAGRTDTLILVTADHETGGLNVIANNGVSNYPTVSWSTGGHTGVNVPIYARGVNAELISGEIDNTELFAIAVTPTDCNLNNGHADYCKNCGPCFEGEGDCDNDNECQQGLTCVPDPQVSDSDICSMISVTCPGDSDLDEDVDGVDLADYIFDSEGLGFDDFAANFGKINCP